MEVSVVPPTIPVLLILMLKISLVGYSAMVSVSMIRSRYSGWVLALQNRMCSSCRLVLFERCYKSRGLNITTTSRPTPRTNGSLGAGLFISILNCYFNKSFTINLATNETHSTKYQSESFETGYSRDTVVFIIGIFTDSHCTTSQREPRLQPTPEY